MEGFGLAEVLRFAHEPAEQGPLLFGLFPLGQTFGVPLHADDALHFGRFHRLDDAVGAAGRHAEPGSGLFHGLMVETVDSDGARGLHDVREQAAGFNRDVMRRHIACGLLAVGQKGGATFCGGVFRGQVLNELAAQSDGDHLHAPADAHHRHLTAVGLADEVQLQDVAVDADAREIASGLFAQERGLDVAAAAQQQAVHEVERGQEGLPVLIGRDDEGHAAFAQHGVVVGACQLAAFLAEVAGDADDCRHQSSMLFQSSSMRGAVSA